MKWIKRSQDFDISLDIQNPAFIAPPRESQRRWLLNRTMNELVRDLNALDKSAQRFVPGSERPPLAGRAHAAMRDEDIMEDWQRPLMEAMAAIVTERGGDILEVGFGRGISASCIQAHAVRSHTLIECNESVADRFDAWRQHHRERDIRLVRGLWQDTIGALGLFDGIFFHTYPLDEDEYIDYALRGATFAEHFFPSAAEHLKPGGVLTYMSNEIDSLSRGHQRALFKHFSTLTLQVFAPLELPVNVRDAWWADSMVLVKALR